MLPAILLSKMYTIQSGQVGQSAKNAILEKEEMPGSYRYTNTLYDIQIGWFFKATFISLKKATYLSKTAIEREFC